MGKRRERVLMWVRMWDRVWMRKRMVHGVRGRGQLLKVGRRGHV